MKNHLLKTALSLFGKLMIAKVFGFVLTMTIFMALNGIIGSIITQICSAMLVIVLLYSSSFEMGFKEVNRSETEGRTPDPLLGLKAGAIAAIPDFIAAVALVAVKPGFVGSTYPILFGILNNNYLPFQQALLSQTLTVAEQPMWHYIVVAATVLIIPICCGFGYRLGLTQYSLSDCLLYTTPEARERHKQKKHAGKNKGWRRFLGG